MKMNLMEDMRSAIKVSANKTTFYAPCIEKYKLQINHHVHLKKR